MSDFDINADGLTTPRLRTEPVPPAPETTEVPVKTHQLDGQASQDRLRRVRVWYEQEMERQAYNRFAMAQDEDFYDGLQYTEEEFQELLDRGQPPTVYNEVKPTTDWMIGTERRTRIDYRVLPRRKEASRDAEIKTEYLKYLDNVNKQAMARSKAFARAIKAGLGWIEVGVRGDPTDEPVFYRAQSWRQMLYDTQSVELDLSDARYVFRWKDVDTDVAQAYFPDRADVVRTAQRDGTGVVEHDEDDIWYLGARVTAGDADYPGPSQHSAYIQSYFGESRRDRVRIYECWYREPTRVKKMLGGIYDGEVYLPDSEHDVDLKAGVASTYDKVEMRVRCLVYCDGGVLWDGPSPYRHNRFPFVPVWCYRRARDNAPYGVIRNVRGPQEALNKRMSKALWILSTNQIELEEGAVEDIEELREEAARPDGILVTNPGRKLIRHRDTALAEEHIMLAQQDQQMIRAVGGVTAENLGRETNANSGKAILARQDQGSVVTTEPFDNLRLAVQLAGEIELSLIEQYTTSEKVVRITGERGHLRFVTVNGRDEETGELSDITAQQADFIIAEQDYRDSLRIAMFESLFDIVGRLAQMSPDVAFKMLDLVFDMADIPGRDEIVARIRQLNGMRGPDEDLTPEEQAAEQARQQEQAQEQQMAKQLMLQRAVAELAELKNKVAKLDAEAANSRLEGIEKALRAASEVLLNPAIAPMADDLVRGAGHEDQKARLDALDQIRAGLGQAMQQQAGVPAQQGALPAPMQQSAEVMPQ